MNMNIRSVVIGSSSKTVEQSQHERSHDHTCRPRRLWRRLGSYVMTPGARKVLSELAADEDCDLVQEGVVAYCGDRRTTPRVVKELLWCLAISVSWNEGTSAIYYAINGTGRSILRRPELEQEIFAALGKKDFAFSIKNDRVVPADEAFTS